VHADDEPQKEQQHEQRRRDRDPGVGAHELADGGDAEDRRQRVDIAIEIACLRSSWSARRA